MNVQVIYASLSGHSRKIAQAIAKQTKITAQDIKDAPQIPPCDLLIIVSGIYGGQSKAELLEFTKKLSPQDIKKVVLLTSSTKNKPQGSLRKTLTDAGLTVEKDEFTCKGSFLFMAMGHPNAYEIEAAVVFAERQISKVKAHE